MITASNGSRVAVVVLSLTPDKRDGRWYRVTDKYGYFVGDARTIPELEYLGIDAATRAELQETSMKPGLAHHDAAVIGAALAAIGV